MPNCTPITITGSSCLVHGVQMSCMPIGCIVWRTCGSDTVCLPRGGHTTGDGNCAWRALCKAYNALDESKSEGLHWKRLKKHALKFALIRNLGSDMKRKVANMRTMGAWANKVTFMIAAAYLRHDVVVDLGGVTYRIGVQGECCVNGYGTRGDVCVAIRNHHCVHSYSAPDAYCARVSDGGANDISKLDSECFNCAGRDSRIRTRRITLETSFGQDLHFVPKDWSPEIIEREIAKVWGCKRNWLEWQWSNWTLSAEHSNERPVLSAPWRDRLNAVTAYLGTIALAPQVREVNRVLRLVAPHETWLSFAFVSHHNVDWHVDRMNNEHSFVVTLNGVRTYLEVDTDVSCMRRAVCTSNRVVYFDAIRYE
eukprot:2056546-Amphidinium_carterae.1